MAAMLERYCAFACGGHLGAFDWLRACDWLRAWLEDVLQADDRFLAKTSGLPCEGKCLIISGGN